MEGVGARLGRSSTRYGPTTVFTGSVRRWKKRWVHVAPSPNGAANSNHGGGRFRANGNADEGSDAVAASTSSTGNQSSSHLFLYKWTPLTQSNNSNKDDNAVIDTAKDDTSEEERPKRKCKYIPVALLEQQKIEDTEENNDDEVKPSDGEEIAEDPASTPNGLDENPDAVPMEESQDDGQQGVRQDLNESLDLNSQDHEDSESKPEEAS